MSVCPHSKALAHILHLDALVPYRIFPKRDAMQESTPNPQPAQPATAPQDIHWGIAYLRQDVQDLRQDLRQQGEDIQELRQDFRQDMQQLRQEFRQDLHQLAERLDKVDQRFEKVYQRQDSHFRWLMGTMITLLVSFGSAIIAAIKL